MKRNPLYIFQDTSETGIYNVPLQSTVHLLDRGNGFPMFLQLVKKDNLTEYSTMGDLLDNPDHYIDITASGSSLSQLEKIIEVGKTGWRLFGRDPFFYGNIGAGAIDLSENDTGDDAGGATGETSFATGLETIAEGRTSFSAGSYSNASGENSLATGSGTKASGDNSSAFGYATISSKLDSVSFGRFNIGDLNGLVLSVGNGMDNLTRSNVFEVYNDGRIAAPSLSVSDINSTPYSLITKEYLSTETKTSQLELIIEDGKTGWRLLGRDSDLFGDIGEGAVDLSNGNGPSVHGATGTDSFTSGTQTIAKGISSFAAGNASHALGDYSHVEGNSNIALGESSHTEGMMTKANGIVSHSEGKETIANGDYSHAEGLKTQALGATSHTEGEETRADGAGAHAEGYRTIAQGAHSHAEGANTLANGDNSHASGSNTVAPNNNSFACGQFNAGQHAYNIFEVGIGADAANKANALEIRMNTTAASSDGAILAPYLTTAMIDNATNRCLITKEYVSNTIVSQFEKVVIANGTDCGSNALPTSHAYRIYHRYDTNPSHYSEPGSEAIDLSYSTLAGKFNGASGYASFAEGVNTVASGCHSHAAGIGTIAAGVNQFVVGSYNISDTDTNFIVGNGDDSTRKNSLEVYTDGSIIAPSLEKADIAAHANDKILVTREYLTSVAGSGTTVEPTVTDGQDVVTIPGNVKVTSVFLNGFKLRPDTGVSHDYSVVFNGTDTIVTLASPVVSGDWLEITYV